MYLNFISQNYVHEDTQKKYYKDSRKCITARKWRKTKDENRFATTVIKHYLPWGYSFFQPTVYTIDEKCNTIDLSIRTKIKSTSVRYTYTDITSSKKQLEILSSQQSLEGFPFPYHSPHRVIIRRLLLINPFLQKANP